MQQEKRAKDSPPGVIEMASRFVGHEETAPNSSVHIDNWLGRLDIPMGSNYCAAFVSFILDSSEMTYPTVRSGVAQHFITRNSIKATRVLDGSAVIPAGYIVVWRRGNHWTGHVGFVEKDWRGARGYTIEANTTPGRDQGDQGRGHGVYRKERTIVPTAYFRITNFTPTRREL